jgi:hypothetical protein
MRSLRARLQILLVALTVLLGVAASQRSHYFCKMMGRAVAECCCARGRAVPVRKNLGATARADDCCELIAGDGQPVLAVQQAAPPQVVMAALVVALPGVAYSPPSFTVVGHTPSLARAPPALGPPLFLSHCALLI